MKLLYLCSKVYWDQKVPRTRFHSVEAMREFADVHCTGNGFLDWDGEATIAANLSRTTRPDWIFVYKPDQYTGWEQLGIPVVTSFNDAWETESRLMDIRLPKCRVVIMHHANEMAEWRERCPDVRFVNIPYPINPDVFKDHGREKNIDILLTGAVDSKIYPLRYRFSRLIESGAFEPYHAVWRKHSGYRIQNPEAEAEAYAKCLNSAKICLADTSRYQYAAEKYHEIPACRSVLCGNLPDERQMAFSQFILQIENRMSDAEIIDRITTLLAARDMIAPLADAGYGYVHSTHTVRQYAKQFIEILSG